MKIYKKKIIIALYGERKQKYQNGNIHRKLKVTTSEREGKLSNPRAARARHAGRKIRKFTETRARPPRAPCIDFLPVIGTVCMLYVELCFTRFIHPNQAEVSKVDYSSKARSSNVREGG